MGAFLARNILSPRASRDTSFPSLIKWTVLTKATTITIQDTSNWGWVYPVERRQGVKVLINLAGLSVSCSVHVWLFATHDCCSPGSSVSRILQARILEWIAIPSSRGSSQLRDWTQVSCIAGGFFTIWATREVLLIAVAAAAVLLQSCPASKNSLFIFLNAFLSI